MDRIVILGSGMAGFGAAHRLHQEGVTSTMYEKNNYHGGHTTSYKHNSGFVFDEGPHISFTGVERLQNLLAESVSQKYQVNRAYVNNYWKGHWIKHPAQCNLHGLPGDLVVKILRDYIHALHSEHAEIHNYADWLMATYGQSFAETFPMEYTIKYHTTTAANMSVDWLGPRMYQPKLEEVLRGALLQLTPDVHYVTEFRYPSYDGFISYLKIFVKQTKIMLEHAVAGIAPSTKTLRFKNGVSMPYDHIISSVPLPELIPMIEGVPKDVLEASRKLACTTAVIVSIGVNRPDLIDAHWTYFYDQDIFFTRLSTPHKQSPNNVPPGCGSLQAECYYSPKYRPLDRKPEECIPPVIADLKRIGVIREDDKILFSDAKLVPYANVIFDLDRKRSLELVHAYLDEIGIAYCGRYGDWTYIWTDQAFMSGERSAQKVLDRLGKITGRM